MGGDLMPSSPVGRRITAGFIAAANLLVAHFLYTVGGRNLLERGLPMSERKR